MTNHEIEKAQIYVKKLEIKGDITKKNAKYIIDFVEKLSARGYSDNRQRKYLYVLPNITRMLSKDFDKATQKDMNRIATEIRDKYNGETPRDYLVILRIFMRYIRELEGKKFGKNEFPDEVSDIEPGSRKNNKMLPTELFTLEEVKQLANHTRNLRDRCFILMLYDTGCRIGELIGDENYPGIQLKHLEFDKYGAKVTVMGKTGSRVLRLIPSAPAISNWLQEHPDRNNKNAPLFCGIWTNRKGRIQYRYWNKLLKEIGEKAGIDKPMNPHHFRHSRASELAKFMTESQLCQYLGWVQGSKQSRTYVHMSGRDTEKTVLAMYDKVEEEKPGSEFKPIKCPRCGVENDPASKFCRQCSLGLELQAVMEYEKSSKETLKTVEDTDTLTSLVETIKALKEKVERLEKTR